MRKHIIYTIVLITVCLASLQCTKDTAKAFTPGTGQGGSLARFAIAGNYLYTVDKEKLRVFNISNAAEPILKTTVNIGFEIETIYPFKDKLFIGSTSVVYIFSIENPEQPQKLSTAISPEVIRRCDPVVAKDNVAFATLRTSGPCGGTQSILAVYDITDITKPVQKATYPIAEPYGLGYAEDALYVCDKDSLMVFDISKPFQPKFITSVKDGSFVDVIPASNTLICWVKNGIILYDISNPFTPQLITKIN
ncbi:hypothetical protein D3H65_20790 [Paraflavitalea soli]|uniref:YncE family protein n=1 Tax=Paraflavitalea soli TaxID=2315862 RepID=A0A3B7MSM5_9BACT|nr:hypothetical protein [Paraflavitalea soli]AXY76279.1 hypothetical protein D3H65_20790 [Paraflavitalea soli]